MLPEARPYARVWTTGAERVAAITIWNIHYNYDRPHTAAGDRPPASRLHARVTNVTSQNTLGPALLLMTSESASAWVEGGHSMGAERWPSDLGVSVR
jgi:hypothetical protein